MSHTTQRPIQIESARATEGASVAAAQEPQELGPSSLAGLKVHVATYGCQMNVLDSELVVGGLVDAGSLPVESADEADVVLYNTCSVRQHAEDRVASQLGRMQHRCRREPNLIVGIIGCQAQRDGADLLRRFPHVRLVAGTRMFHRIPELVSTLQAQPEQRLIADNTDESVQFRRRVKIRPQWYKAQITVMRGCDHTCTYCIVPAVRGREVDVPAAEVLEEAKALVDDGVKELMLLGQNVDSWGRRLEPKQNFGDLLALLDKELQPHGLERLFFITSHPSDLKMRILEAMRDCPTVCEYLHLPAQSGSSRQLRLMRRGYTREKYVEIVQKAREYVPSVSIASDFIVGFPGETEEDFEQSKTLIEEVGFTQSFIFKYSPRPGTRASEGMEDDVPEAEKKRRNNELIEVQLATQERLNQAKVGTVQQVLCEGPTKRDASRLGGRDRNHQMVVWPDDGDTHPGELVWIHVDEATQLTLKGQRVAAPVH